MIFTQLNSGKSVEGNEIEAYQTEIQSGSYLYLLGGTHGDEVEGVYVLQKLFDWMKTEHRLKDLPVIVVPILNPDGYRAGTRVNSNGVDLNRNYATESWSPDFKKAKYNPGSGPLSEPENTFLNDLFKRFTPKLILSFHSWKPILNYNGDCQDVAEHLSKFNNYPPQADIGYPTPGSLGSYVPEKFKGSVLTFECPTLHNDLSLKDIWEQNEAGLKDLIQSTLIVDKLS